MSGRAPPSKEDKDELLQALNLASQGHLPLKMLYFYKYIVKHGEDDGMPYVDKDLFFYLEVNKFRDATHLHLNEEMVKSKVQAILDIYLECTTQPALQVDVPTDVQQRSIRGAKRYVEGKEMLGTIFDDAQICVFRELLPYWAGFCKTWQVPEDRTKLPLTKKQKEMQKRFEAFSTMPTPKVSFKLPKIPPGSSVASFSFTLNDGVKYKLEVVRDPETPGTVEWAPPPPSRRRSIAMKDR